MQKELQDLQPQLIVTAEENSKLLVVSLSLLVAGLLARKRFETYCKKSEITFLIFSSNERLIRSHSYISLTAIVTLFTVIKKEAAESENMFQC